MQKILPNKKEYQRLVGVELGSVALVSLISLKSNKQNILIRKTSKQYGTLKLIEGTFIAGEHVVIVEDVLHSSTQLDETFEKLEKSELKIHSIVAYANFLGVNSYKGYSIKSLINDNNVN